MLPKDVLERFLDGPFNYEELRNRVSAYVGEKLAGQEARGGAQPMDIGHIDKSEGEDEDVNAVQRSCVTDACFFLQFWPRCFGLCVSQFCACFQRPATASHDHVMAQHKTASIHSPCFINLVAEQIHAELVRLATELEAVRGQVQTECNALRNLFPQTTAALSGSQHDRRLNHREAGRHLPQQFGGSLLDCGDFGFRMEGYAAVLSRDGQGGALLREVAKTGEV